MSIRPEGVRIVHADGSNLFLELAHAGVDDEGYDRWAVLTPVDFQAGDHIEIEVMPQMCCIEFPLEEWREVA
jgi:2,4-dienoyl-CoA reductase-like NADH-dependent reductase (Old Yellow Enzyme family)